MLEAGAGNDDLCILGRSGDEHALSAVTDFYDNSLVLLPDLLMQRNERDDQQRYLAYYDHPLP